MVKTLLLMLTLRSRPFCPHLVLHSLDSALLKRPCACDQLAEVRTAPWQGDDAASLRTSIRSIRRCGSRDTGLVRKLKARVSNPGIMAYVDLKASFRCAKTRRRSGVCPCCDFRACCGTLISPSLSHRGVPGLQALLEGPSTAPDTI